MCQPGQDHRFLCGSPPFGRLQQASGQAPSGRLHPDGARLVFTRPQALWRLFLIFSKEDADHGDTGDYAELLSIGVDPDVQRSGAGKQLLQALEKEVESKNGKQLSLTTDYDDNDKAIGFYRALGYHEWYNFVTYPQRRMYRMIKTLQP